MKTRNILIIILGLTAFNTSAQYNFIEGYIISNDMDTIHGYIFNDTYTKNNEQCNFKTNLDSKSQTYYPKDIHSYRFNEGKYYISKDIYSYRFNENKHYIPKEIQQDKVKKRVFLEYLIKGELSIYYRLINGLDMYYVEKKNDTLLYLDNTHINYQWDSVRDTYVKYHPEEVKKSKSSNRYKGVLTYTMQDTPELQNQVENLQLGHKNLISLAENYHNAICDNNECITFEKQNKTKVILGINSGYYFSSYANIDKRVENRLKTNNILLPALFLIIDLNRLNENLKFKTEFQIAPLNCSVTEGSYETVLSGINYTIPLLLQYLFPTKKVKPFLNAGIALNKLSNVDFYTNQYYSSDTTFVRSLPADVEIYSKLNFGFSVSSGIVIPMNKLYFEIEAGYNHFLSINEYRNLQFKLGIGYVFK